MKLKKFNVDLDFCDKAQVLQDTVVPGMLSDLGSTQDPKLVKHISFRHGNNAMHHCCCLHSHCPRRPRKLGCGS
jgi:hypothetical protein